MLKKIKVIGAFVILLFIVILLILFVKNNRSNLEIEDEISLSACLPENIKLEDIVSAEVSSYVNGTTTDIKKVTVEQKLSEIGAFCKGAKLLDSKGKEISFYFLTGCWGNPPIDYNEILQKQRDELNSLKESFNVIEMTCNPSGIPLL